MKLSEEQALMSLLSFVVKVMRISGIPVHPGGVSVPDSMLN